MDEGPRAPRGRAQRQPGPGTLRGSNQAGVRAHNERVVLSLIRRHGALAKAEIARLSGLSPQTASVIIKLLEQDGLVVAGDPRRGRVGQPSVPMRLQARGAFALGLKIGRRTSEIVLMDFSGAVLEHRAILYETASRAAIQAFAVETTALFGARLSPAEQGRIAGFGVCMPSELWLWTDGPNSPEETGDDVGEGAEWAREGIAAELERGTGLPVFLGNDASAACAAEQAFGTTGLADYVYFFVGAFAGGGIVIDGRPVPGRTGNAGALGSLPVPSMGTGAPVQLIEEASVHILERAARQAGLKDRDLWHPDSDWGALGPILDAWIERAATGLAHAALSASAVYDFEAALIDGSFSGDIRARLARETGRILAGLDRRGLSALSVREGTIGRAAREIGAASLPFFARYFLDHRVLNADPRG